MGSYDQGQRLGAMSNLDATCSAGNCVDLSKLDPHHTFSPSGVPLSKESRPRALPFTMEKCGAIFPITFNDCGGIFPALNFSGQKFSRTKFPPSPPVAFHPVQPISRTMSFVGPACWSRSVLCEHLPKPSVQIMHKLRGSTPLPAAASHGFSVPAAATLRLLHIDKALPTTRSSRPATPATVQQDTHMYAHIPCYLNHCVPLRRWLLTAGGKACM